MLIDGENIVPMNERQLLRVRRKFGMVFQGAALFDSMTVAENVAFGLRRHEHLTEAEIARRVAEALEMVDLPGTENKKPAELSGGMSKRVGLARAIIYEPQIVLYDEPTTGLDPIVSDSIDQLIMRVRDRLKVTTVVVTHDMRTRAARGPADADAARAERFTRPARRRNFSRRGTRWCGSSLTAWRTRKRIESWNKSRLETKVGLFVFIGLVLLAVLLIQFSKGTSLFRGTYDLRLHARNVGGLKPRAQRAAGRRAGRQRLGHPARRRTARA